mgnify:CR=1 FL=1
MSTDSKNLQLKQTNKQNAKEIINVRKKWKKNQFTEL